MCECLGIFDNCVYTVCDIITRGAKREGTVIVLNWMSVSSSVISGSKRFSSGLI